MRFHSWNLCVFITSHDFAAHVLMRCCCSEVWACVLRAPRLVFPRAALAEVERLIYRPAGEACLDFFNLKIQSPSPSKLVPTQYLPAEFYGTTCSMRRRVRRRSSLHVNSREPWMFVMSARVTHWCTIVASLKMCTFVCVCERVWGHIMFLTFSALLFYWGIGKIEGKPSYLKKKNNGITRGTTKWLL